MACLAVVTALVPLLVAGAKGAGADGGAAAYPTSDISVGSNQSGAMQLLTVGDNGDVRTNWQAAPNVGFNGWAPLGGPSSAGIASNVAVGRNRSGALQLFVEGDDHSSWTNWQAAPNAGFNGWARLGTFNLDTLSGDISVGVESFGALSLFSRTTGGSSAINRQVSADSAFSGWQSLGGLTGGVVISSNLAVGNNASGALQAFARATDGSSWTTWERGRSIAFNGWVPLGKPSPTRLADDISTGVNQSGALQLFSRTEDGSSWTNWQVAPNAGFNGWAPLGGLSNNLTIASSIAVGTNASGALQLFAVASDGSSWTNWQVAPNAGFNGWAPLGRPADLAGNISVGQNASGAMQLFVYGSDGSSWTDWQVAPSSGFNGWAPLGSPG